MIRRVQEMEYGSAWSSKKQWFWFSFGGYVHSFLLCFGRFSIGLERKA